VREVSYVMTSPINPTKSPAPVSAFSRVFPMRYALILKFEFVVPVVTAVPPFVLADNVVPSTKDVFNTRVSYDVDAPGYAPAR
jgi:hypothetical protein